MADRENPALGKNLSKWKGVGAQVLKSYLDSENGGEKDDDNFGVDAFLNDFEDEFPNTVDEGAVKPVYSEEAGRAFDQRPWGLKFGDRPKIHELNQPQRAQELGWRVIDFYPSRERKAEYYRLAGTPAELRIMTQLLRATREITGKNIVFEEWFKLWEDGFPEFREDRSVTNFPLDGENPWRGKTENKPRYREWTKPQQRLDFGYRVIEYWRDRSLESESVVLSGTDLDLIRHILQIEYEGGGSAISKGKGGSLPYMKGQPLITLHFIQDTDKVGKNPDGSKKSPEAGKISFRIMDKTDNPKSPLNKISKSDLKTYAARIKAQFGDNGKYVWEKGKTVVSYRNRYQGFESWYLVKSKADGIQLITRLLAIVEQTIDLQYVKTSITEDEAKAYPSNPNPIIVLGEEISAPIERPIADVRFKHAEIYLPKARKTIRLVTGQTINYT